jgi:hypothetical protein
MNPVASGTRILDCFLASEALRQDKFARELRKLCDVADLCSWNDIRDRIKVFPQLGSWSTAAKLCHVLASIVVRQLRTDEFDHLEWDGKKCPRHCLDQILRDDS